MRRNGYRVIPVNPNETEVFGEKAYPDLFAVPEKIDLVDVFRRPTKQGRRLMKRSRLAQKPCGYRKV